MGDSPPGTTPSPGLSTVTIVDDLEALLAVLPPHIAGAVRSQPTNFELLEVVMDLGRRPEARYPGAEAALGREVSEDDIEYVVSRVGEFTADNRAGIARTLHRISCIRNRKGRIVGLTCRVGRAVFGTSRIIEDLVRDHRSVLLLGQPGVGKTTLLREVARFLADECNRRVIVVDTSNEIAGDADIPHPAIGGARRMQVPAPRLQHQVMIEAVENHMPEVIVIDEIGTDLEAAAARTIAERGVHLIATAHGTTFENLIMNPTLSDLVGGAQSVILSDEEARRRGTQKAILERRAPPTFDVLVEIQAFNRVAVHRDVGAAVDAVLGGSPVYPEVRELDADGAVRVVHVPSAPPRAFLPSGPAAAATPGARHRIFPFGVSRARLEEALRRTGVLARIVDRADEADVVLALRGFAGRKARALRDAEARGIPIHVVKSDTLFQLERCLFSIGAGDPLAAALREAEEAIDRARASETHVDLAPQNAHVRRLQHMLAERHELLSRSLGKEPRRYVRILPADASGTRPPRRGDRGIGTRVR
jgi:stage III sporulation protein SpoIIIAA